MPETYEQKFYALNMTKLYFHYYIQYLPILMMWPNVLRCLTDRVNSREQIATAQMLTLRMLRYLIPAVTFKKK